MVERVVHAEASKRSWRVAVNQSIIDRTLATIQARSVMYARQLGESESLNARDLAEEETAIEAGFFEVDELGNQVLIPTTTYPKKMWHPGSPTGAAFGLMVKDYRGKDARAGHATGFAGLAVAVAPTRARARVPARSKSSAWRLRALNVRPCRRRLGLEFAGVRRHFYANPTLRK